MLYGRSFFAFWSHDLGRNTQSREVVLGGVAPLEMKIKYDRTRVSGRAVGRKKSRGSSVSCSGDAVIPTASQTDERKLLPENITI